MAQHLSIIVINVEEHLLMGAVFVSISAKKSPKSTHASFAIKVTVDKNISTNMLKSVPSEVNG